LFFLSVTSLFFFAEPKRIEFCQHKRRLATRTSVYEETIIIAIFAILKNAHNKFRHKDGRYEYSRFTFPPLNIPIVLFSTCDDDKDYSIEPQIDFVKVEFIENSNTSYDTLRIVFTYTDGDADLGLSSDDLEYQSYPYNYIFFFQENNGNIEKLHTKTVAQYSGDWIGVSIIDIPDPDKGKLVYPRTRKKSGYAHLPPYKQYSCYPYFMAASSYMPLIEAEDVAVLDGTWQIQNTITLSGTTYYAIKDTLLFEINPDHYNLEIDFLVDYGQGFTEFDWKSITCYDYDARFPLLTASGKAGPFKIHRISENQGILSYSMASVGFKTLFSNKKMKLRLSIKDRALHTSNVIETPEFYLDGI
jgi:hypothetical protein